jgi:hypothetical protein
MACMVETVLLDDESMVTRSIQFADLVRLHKKTNYSSYSDSHSLQQQLDELINHEILPIDPNFNLTPTY